MKAAATQVHVDRLRELYAVMAGVPDEKVNLRHWRDGREVDDKALMTQCCTTACAVGWACAYPPFKAEGLSYIQGFGPSLSSDKCKWPFLDWWPAVHAFFGLKESESKYLFQTGKRPFERPLTDRQKVMRRIRRQLLKDGNITYWRNEELALEEGVLA